MATGRGHIWKQESYQPSLKGYRLVVFYSPVSQCSLLLGLFATRCISTFTTSHKWCWSWESCKDTCSELAILLTISKTQWLGNSTTSNSCTTNLQLLSSRSLSLEGWLVNSSFSDMHFLLFKAYPTALMNCQQESHDVGLLWHSTFEKESFRERILFSL